MSLLHRGNVFSFSTSLRTQNEDGEDADDGDAGSQQEVVVYGLDKGLLRKMCTEKRFRSRGSLPPAATHGLLSEALQSIRHVLKCGRVLVDGLPVDRAVKDYAASEHRAHDRHAKTPADLPYH